MDQVVFVALNVVVELVHLDTELKALLEVKENFFTDLKLDVYRYTDANEELEKKLKGSDFQMVESMK